jgi:hypothetical protein
VRSAAGGSSEPTGRQGYTKVSTDTIVQSTRFTTDATLLMVGGAAMNRNSKLTIGIATVWLAVFGMVISAQDKYTVKVPGGLAFSEFRGYEGWQAISISRNARVVAMILGNPVMIDA